MLQEKLANMIKLNICCTKYWIRHKEKIALCYWHFGRIWVQACILYIPTQMLLTGLRKSFPRTQQPKFLSTKVKDSLPYNNLIIHDLTQCPCVASMPQNRSAYVSLSQPQSLRCYWLCPCLEQAFTTRLSPARYPISISKRKNRSL